MKWIPIKDRLPRSKKQVCAFVRWHSDWESPSAEYIGTYNEALMFRKDELNDGYTHWIPLNGNPNKKLKELQQ